MSSKNFTSTKLDSLLNDQLGNCDKSCGTTNTWAFMLTNLMLNQEKHLVWCQNKLGLELRKKIVI